LFQEGGALKLAIFDFDGTLFPRDTLPFLLRRWHSEGRSFKRLAAAYASVAGLYVRYKLGIARGISRELMRRTALQRVTRLFGGMSEAEVSAFFERSAALIVPQLRPSAMEELRRTKAAGFHTVLLSGGYETLMAHVGAAIGVDTVIGTALHYKNGVVDASRPLDIACGDDKAVRLTTAFADSAVDWQASAAFADSYSDLPVMKLVGQPVAVCPDRELADMLPSLGWRVIDG
jgi:HAD superfamily hydrolase (TIGR01490 family)